MNIKLISGLIIAICAAQAHALTDEPIECEVLDPEIHDALGIMVYQHLNTSTNAREAIVQFIEDGDLVGDAKVLESDLAPFPVSLAGPKFSHGKNTSSQLEDYLAYTRQIDAQTFAVGIRRYDGSVPSCDLRSDVLACFPATDEGQIPIETPDQGTERRIVYTTEEETYEYRAQAVYHRLDESGDKFLSWAPLENFVYGEDGTGELSFPDDSGTIWARLQEKRTQTSPVLRASTIYTPSGQAAPLPQVFLIDASNPANEEQVTPNNTPGLKFNPYLFWHAGLNRNMVVYRSLESATQSNLVIYVEETLGDGATWDYFATLSYDSIGSPDEKFLLSPEAFLYDNGQSIDTYLLFYTADELLIPEQTRGSVWIAKINDNASIDDMKISPATSRVRVEPEVHFPTPTSLPVFFYTQYSHPLDASCGVQTCIGFCVQNFNLRRITLSAQEMP